MFTKGINNIVERNHQKGGNIFMEEHMKRYQALKILFHPDSHYAHATACTIPPKSTRDSLI